jgi:hypothetical protein
MARTKRFKVELALRDADGQASDLARDLETDGAKRLRRLDKLTEDFLDEARPMEWPPGPEGAWIYVRLAKDIAICQWHPGPKALWDLGLRVGILKVVRIIRREDLLDFLERAEVHDENE